MEGPKNMHQKHTRNIYRSAIFLPLATHDVLLPELRFFGAAVASGVGIGPTTVRRGGNFRFQGRKYPAEMGNRASSGRLKSGLRRNKRPGLPGHLLELEFIRAPSIELTNEDLS